MNLSYFLWPAGQFYICRWWLWFTSRRMPFQWASVDRFWCFGNYSPVFLLESIILQNNWRKGSEGEGDREGAAVESLWACHRLQFGIWRWKGAWCRCHSDKAPVKAHLDRPLQFSRLRWWTYRHYLRKHRHNHFEVIRIFIGTSKCKKLKN